MRKKDGIRYMKGCRFGAERRRISYLSAFTLTMKYKARPLAKRKEDKKMEEGTI